MAIHKITPRALDKATDHKLVPATAFIDAVNVVFTEDESSDGDGGGDAGVIKNLRGNTAISYHTSKDAIAAGDFKIIGSTTDPKMKVVYFYVYHENLNEQGVWAYDPYGKLGLPSSYVIQQRTQGGVSLGEYENVNPYSEHTLKCVVRGPFFNFKQNSVVQGNVVYNNTQNIPNDVVNAININEPKKLCVNACLFASAIKSDDILVSEGINEEYAALDVNGNGIIDEEDLAVFLQLQQTVITEVPMPPQIVTIENTGSPYFGNTYYVEDISKFDLDGDGSIGVTDNGIFLLDVYGQQVQEAEIISSTEGVADTLVYLLIYRA
jgi:hypothetical protein